MRWVLALGCLVCELGILVWLLTEGISDLDFLLPLHLCDISILIAPVVLLTGNWLLFELLFFWGIGGAMQALLTPIVTDGFPAPFCIYFFAAHGLIIASALYATVVMRQRPTVRSIPRVWLITNAYGLLIILVNLALETNYLFIMHKPATPSLLDVMGPWPWYVVVLDAVALALICVCYLPFLVRDKLAARRLRRPRRRTIISPSTEPPDHPARPHQEPRP